MILRSLIVGQSKLELYENGDSSALTESQREGLGIFQNNCIACHQGANFSDRQFHNVGLFDLAVSSLDLGRYEITGSDSVRGAFKTPGLRDVHLRQNLLGHDGSMDLMSLIDNYSNGGNFQTAVPVDRFVRALHLTDGQKASLADFLLEGLKSNFNGVYSQQDPWP